MNNQNALHPGIYLSAVIVGLFGIIASAALAVWEFPENIIKGVSIGSSVILTVGLFLLFIRSFRIIDQKKKNKNRHWVILFIFPYAAVFYYPFKEDFYDEF